MKRFFTGILLLMAILPVRAIDKNSAYWITSAREGIDKPNSWIAFRRDIVLDKAPKNAVASIAADTKYWLWINGKLVIFEGGLKRGPDPRDSYYDKVDLAAYLKKGENRIAVLLWHFGKDGFSHKNSGRAGLLFHMDAGKTKVGSDSKWECRIHPAYGTSGKPDPNYRLAESNIRFDARNDISGWQNAPLHSLPGFQPGVEIGRPGDAPWNNLIERPIPQWKDFGIKEAEFERHKGNGTDTVIAFLPYNMQMTPVITLNDPSGGHLIGIATDHSVAGGTDNLRAEYITMKGSQEYESFGWLNGEKILLTVPAGVNIISVRYRETGYNTTPDGDFECSDDFYNRFWQKALRTLYVNMRDNYFDCPDRERAQWWGDVVLLMGESFYTYSTSAHALMRKAILELAAWQKPDGTLFSPVPAGNYDNELPGQMLASIGRYGFWNYYMNTGDKETIAQVYPAVKRYLSIWETDDTGLTAARKGGWTWGDWGDHRDIRLIFAGWHYIALEAAANMALLLDMPEDAAAYRQTMSQVKDGYNKCWNGYAYRHPAYHGETDDRVQALAVISGIAPKDKYPYIYAVLQTQLHASPYMEKYVMEALFRMGYGGYALERTRKRFSGMVNIPGYTTLFEGWGIGKEGFGGGTTNHAWSGGAQTVIAEYLCGIAPLEAAYKTFLIEPCPATFASAAISVPTVQGLIGSSFKNSSEGFTMKVNIPKGTTAIVRLPEDASAMVGINGKAPGKLQEADPAWHKDGYTSFKLLPGEYVVTRSKAL